MDIKMEAMENGNTSSYQTKRDDGNIDGSDDDDKTDETSQDKGKCPV